MQAVIEWLDDPEVFQVNRLPAHSDHEYYKNEEEYEKRNLLLHSRLMGHGDSFIRKMP